MDELEFDPTGFTGADTTTEIEGLEDHIELLGEDVPEQDYRTPVEQAAEVPTTPEQEQPTGEAVPTEGTPQPEGVPGPSDLDKAGDFAPPPNRFDHVSYNGRIDPKHLVEQGIDPGVIQSTKAHLNLTPDERQMWIDYKENGGDTNLENVRNTFLKIQNDPELLARYDRKGSKNTTMA